MNRPFGHCHIHLGVPFHRAPKPTLGLPTRSLQQSLRQEEAEEKPEQRDHQRPSHELPQGELPAEQDRHDDSELYHEVC